MLGATGPTQCPVLACATGGEAIAEGLELIRRGDADVVVAGSAEAPITPLSMAGFCAIRGVRRRNDEPAPARRPLHAGPGRLELERTPLDSRHPHNLYSVFFL